MSCSKWAYTPQKCDGDYCIGECDLCGKRDIDVTVHCEDCKYSRFEGVDYICDKHSGHKKRFGEDVYDIERHYGHWYCADGELE